MFTDIVGYTALMSKDEAKTLQLLQRSRELLKPIIRQFRGEWLKEMGGRNLVLIRQRSGGSELHDEASPTILDSPNHLSLLVIILPTAHHS